MAHYVERLNLKVGDPIEWPKVEPDIVVDVIDRPTGHLVVAAQTGNVHAWWGRWIPDPGNPNQMLKVLTHHGGRYGWNDIQKPIDQHSHVLEENLGHEVKVESQVPTVPAKPRSLEQFVVAVRTAPDIIEVQGRRAWAGEAVHLIDHAMRGIVYPLANATEMNSRANQLEILQEKLQRSTNPHFRFAGQSLAEGLVTEGSRRLVAFKKSNDELLNRLIEINDIVLGTFNRAASLERYRMGQENVVISVHQRIVEAKEAWDNAQDNEGREKALNNLRDLFGLNMLASLKVQPFRGRIEEILQESHIDTFEDLWLTLDYQGVSRSLTKAESLMQRWSSRIKTRREGAIQTSLPISA